MENLEELAKSIGLNYRYLKNIIINSDYYYYSHFIKKRSGRFRRIDSPNYQIKAIQAWILRFILERIEINQKVNGFIKGRSTKLNAIPHLDKYCIICLDIENFFNSIKKNQIKEVFEQCLEGSYKNISEDLSKICTYKDYLPMGAVTSPYLSNLVFRKADEEIIDFCEKKNFIYTRYADDLSFSSNEYIRINDIEPVIEKIINNYGFTLNKKKSRLYFTGGKMMITGLILNSHKLTLGRYLKKEIRAMIHNFYIKNKKEVNLDKMVGKIAFLRDIEPDYYNINLINYIKKIKERSAENN